MPPPEICPFHTQTQIIRNRKQVFESDMQFCRCFFHDDHPQASMQLCNRHSEAECVLEAGKIEPRKVI
jgi:hypothetical protein